MGINAVFDTRNWALVPFHFWSVVFFVFGCVTGSFLNVCIHRLPRGESIVFPPSHCPHCNYSIPWYLNLPLATWLYLRGKCANCGAPIAIRYFLVELLTGLMFLACWLTFGTQSVWLALVYCAFLSGLIVATFVDFEHFIIPDEITIGGMVVGFLCSFALPALHGEQSPGPSLRQSILGIVVGAGLIYGILRLGKLLIGRKKLQLEPKTRIVFTENAVVLPGQEIPYHDLFYRQSDVIALNAWTVELFDRCYADVKVRLSPATLTIGEEELNPEEVPYLEVLADEIVLPREAMGLGDVKFMAGIGAFLGWPAVIFCLAVSSLLGSLVGVTLITLKKQDRSAPLPYGPYIAVAAALWLFGGRHLIGWWFAR